MYVCVRTYAGERESMRVYGRASKKPVAAVARVSPSLSPFINMLTWPSGGGGGGGGGPPRFLDTPLLKNRLG